MWPSSVIIAASVIFAQAAPSPDLTDFFTKPYWQQIGTTSTKAAVYVSVSSIVGEPEQKDAWLKFDYSNDRTVRHRSDLQKVQINCPERMIRVISITAYNASGVAIMNERAPNAVYTEIVPDSVGAMIHKYVCFTFPAEVQKYINQEFRAPSTD